MHCCSNLLSYIHLLG